MNEKIDVIAIDGPTASGKGTIATLVAQKLGWHYLDSGALYRIAALVSLKKGIDLKDVAACEACARTMAPIFRDNKIYLDGEDITDAIRKEEVGLAASTIAAIPEVRDALLDVQRAYRRYPGLVADGRDMASIVFPDAGLKVFLTASAESRANRRFKQLIAKGISANLTDLTHDLIERDRRDRERAVAPCVPHKEAHVLDSSDLTIDQTVNQVLDWWQETAKKA
ncbi:MAG: (d)CMP kinase [Sutterellaceae bacterium]|nr:(d)CMP kinase [Sutterellaceae bacterium]